MDSSPASSNPKKETIKVAYHKAKLHRRVLCFLVDLFFLFLLTGISFAVANSLLPNAPFYSAVLEKRNFLQVDSGLYETSGLDIVAFAKQDGSPYTNDAERKDFVSSRLNDFYTVHKYCPVDAAAKYEQRKATADNGAGVTLFEMKDGKLVERNLNPTFFLNFYEKELKNHAMSYLFQVDEYFATTRFIFLFTSGEILVFGTIFFAVLYLVIPLWVFPKGRKTLGRAIFRIGIVTRHALVPSRGKYALRWLFEYGFLVLLDFFAFLIPLFVSTGMLFLSENQQNLPDYLFGHYQVDITDDDVYSDPSEYANRKGVHDRSLLEDKDFEIKQNHI